MDGIGSIDTWLQAGGAITTVVLFLRYLVSRDVAQRSIETERHEVLKSMSDSCHSHSKEITEAFVKAVDRSAIAISENTRALGRVHQMLDSGVYEYSRRRRRPGSESIDVTAGGTQKNDSNPTAESV